MPTEYGDFLRSAFLDFMTNHWAGGVVDKKLMRRLRTGQPERFISQTAFARRYGIHNMTAARLLRDQEVPSRSFRCGNSERKVIDSDVVRLSRSHPGKICRARQAAAMIGISTELLKSLRASGDFEVNHFLRTKPGFHELDIEAFVQKLKRLAPSVNNVDVPLPKCVTFTRKGLRITEESIAEFKKRYVCLASIAKTIGTSSRALIGFCKNYEIPIVVAGRQWQKAKQGFVFRQEMRKLLGFRSNRTQGLRPRWESAA